MSVRPLSRRYQLWTALLIIIPCIVLSTVYLFIQFQAAQEDVRQQIRLSVESQQRLIHYWVQERLVTVQEASEDEGVRSLDFTRMEQVFLSKQRFDKNYDSLSFIDKDGSFQKIDLAGGHTLSVGDGQTLL